MCNYGIDWDGPSPYHDDLDTVEVPETMMPADLEHGDLLEAVDPLSYSTEYGIDLYLQLLDFVMRH